MAQNVTASPEKGIGPILVLLAWLMPINAYAQSSPEARTGSRIPVKPHLLDPVRMGAVVKGFGKCLYAQSKPVVIRLLAASDPMSIDYDAAKIKQSSLQRDLGMQKCLGDQAGVDEFALGLKFPPMRLRAMLAEEDYLANHSEVPILPKDAGETVSRIFSTKGEKLQSAKALADFADCVVFNDTPRTDAYLRTVPGSAEERVIARLIAPVLGKCLTRGLTLSFTPESIRGIIADGMWTRYNAPLILDAK